MPATISNTLNLKINNITLAIEGFCQITSLAPILGGFDDRGSNRALGGAKGRRMYTLVLDETDYLLRLHIFGAKDVDGAAHANEFNGLIANIAYLKTNVIEASKAGVTGVVTFPTGTTWTSTVQCVGNLNLPGDIPDSTTDIVGVIRLRVPSATWTVA